MSAGTRRGGGDAAVHAACAAAPHALNMQPVPLSAFVHAGEKLHVLHGGTADTLGVYQAACHLQREWWGPSRGVILIDDAARLRELLATFDRLGKDVPLLACVACAAIADAPDEYDALCRCRTVHVIVTVPLSRVRGRPYRSDSGITALVLPSARLDVAATRVAAAVYCCPLPDNVLRDALSTLPHGRGVTWTCCKSGKPAGAQIAALDYTPTPATAAAQQAVSRAWYWASAKLGAAANPALPMYLGELVTTADSPFKPVSGSPLTRVDGTHIGIQSAFAAEQFAAEVARTRPRTADDVEPQAHDSSRVMQWCAHVTDAHTGAVTPLVLDARRTSTSARHGLDSGVNLTITVSFGCVPDARQATRRRDQSTEITQWKHH